MLDVLLFPPPPLFLVILLPFYLASAPFAYRQWEAPRSSFSILPTFSLVRILISPDCSVCNYFSLLSIFFVLYFLVKRPNFFVYRFFLVSLSTFFHFLLHIPPPPFLLPYILVLFLFIFLNFQIAFYTPHCLACPNKISQEYMPQ